MITTQTESSEHQEILESYRKTHPVKEEGAEEPVASVVETPAEPTRSTEPNLSAEPPAVETPEENPAVTTPEVKTPTFEETFKEKFGKTIEEYNTEIEEAKKPKTPTFKSKKLEKMYEWVELKGGSEEEFNAIHGTDWDKTSDDVVLLANLKKEHPTLTAEELNDMLNYKYKTDADKYDEQEVKIANLLKKTDAAKAREIYKATQAEATSPAHVKDQEAQIAAEKEQKRISQENWEKTVNTAFSSFKDITDNIKTATGLEVGFKYVPDEKETAALKELMYHPNTVFKSYLNKEGKIEDMSRFITDMAILKNWKNIAKNLVAQTEDTFVNGRLKNTDFSTRSVVDAPAETKEKKKSRAIEQLYPNY